ncbi:MULTISPECIES: hypothetical protein [unclassified Synechococcus]|uniref:hypothetical protein n=1 Tax=unclassified Synechococcus TaxID=2626047 RepID=UPI0039C358F8
MPWLLGEGRPDPVEVLAERGISLSMGDIAKRQSQGGSYQEKSMGFCRLQRGEDPA